MTDKKKYCFIVVALSWMMSSGGSVTGQDCCADERAISFERSILPIFRQSCVGCHFTVTRAAGLDLRPVSAYKSLVGRQSLMAGELLVEPGRPDKSFLVEKVIGKPRFGQAMPSYGSILTPGELQSIIDWVRQGAREN